MSDKNEREKHREERLAGEAQAGAGERRRKLLQLGTAAVLLVVLVVVVLIAAGSSSSGGGGGDAQLSEVGAVDSLLKGIPQEGLVLGAASAPVELIEFGDLQCPICKEFSEEILPEVIENQVKPGKVKIAFRNFTIISEESVPAGSAAIAAGAQGRGWTYIELFYRNQGEERSGYVTDEFMTSIAKGAGVKDIAKWNEQRKAAKTTKQVEATTSEAAQRFGFNGTPSFAIRGPNSNGVEVLGTPGSAAAIEEAIKKAG
jgi:protein-disulfide isomerase